jgi:rhamnose transport system permease protein
LLGTLAGLGGFLYLMRFASVDVRTGTGLEFNVIAAVVVGGVAVVGGSGTVLGAVIGVLTLNMLGRGFVLMSIPEFWKTVGTGLAIIAAVAFDTELSRRSATRLKQHRRVFQGDIGDAGA